MMVEVYIHYTYYKNTRRTDFDKKQLKIFQLKQIRNYEWSANLDISWVISK